MRTLPSSVLARCLLAGAVVVVAAGAVFVVCDPSDPPTTTTTTRPHCATAGLPTTVAYETLAGVASNLLSLDVHVPAGVCDVPVVVWVHGGGYQKGDKANQMPDKVALFNAKGWILVSINYRLTVTGDPASAHYPDHFDDVAAAVAWVHRSIVRYGGDPAKVALLGHSAGADIVSNVADDPRYLQRQGLDLSAVVCAGPLDTEGFDKVRSTGDGDSAMWDEALGTTNPDYRTNTSATLFAKAGTRVPATIGVYRGTAIRQQIELAYLSKLASIGVRTATIDARGLSHDEVNSRIGAPGDTVITPPLVAFLTTCFG